MSPKKGETVSYRAIGSLPALHNLVHIEFAYWALSNDKKFLVKHFKFSCQATCFTVCLDRKTNNNYQTFFAGIK